MNIQRSLEYSWLPATVMMAISFVLFLLIHQQRIQIEKPAWDMISVRLTSTAATNLALRAMEALTWIGVLRDPYMSVPRITSLLDWSCSLLDHVNYYDSTIASAVSINAKSHHGSGLWDQVCNSSCCKVVLVVMAVTRLSSKDYINNDAASGIAGQ
eukprot:2838693-Amphidinium_carterae.1